jgi:hypothetical protein
MALLEVAVLSSSGDSQLWGLPPSLPPSLTLLFHAIILTPLESPSMDSVTPSDDASLILINKFDIRYTQFWYLYPVN